MNSRKVWRPFLIVPAAVALHLAGPVAAQNDDQAQTDPAEPRAVQAREADVERRMRDAEARLAEAARQIAELTTERLPRMQRMQRHMEIIDDGQPRLGVTIGGDDDGPVEGVLILGVTPGSAASDARLRSGDIITSINGESLSAEDSDTATSRLLDFMEGVEEGDTLDIEYLRDGKVSTVEVEPTPVDVRVFSFGRNGQGMRAPHVPGMFNDAESRFVFNWTSKGWGDMELVELSEGLGKYFGTDDGLLVVSAPESNALQLEDGDVIQQIDGRSPGSVRHAMRILGSYQAGETLKLDIMRDKKRRTLEVEMPDDRSSGLMPGRALFPEQQS